jgi:hypothetical protein
VDIPDGPIGFELSLQATVNRESAAAGTIAHAAEI